MEIQLTEAGGADDSGFVRPRTGNEALIEQAGNMLADAWGSSNLIPRARLQEAMASPDFRNAAFEVIDREMLESYQALPAQWAGYARRTLNKDFKPKKMVDRTGGYEGLDKVPELTEYPERKIGKSIYELAVTKRGARFAFSWESFVNDELDELQRLPETLSIAARETESREAVGLLTDGDGPNASLFNATALPAGVAGDAASSNLMSGNPALTLASLTAGVSQILKRRDPQGRPIALPRIVLVVPQALAIQAYTITQATTIRTQEGSGAGQRELEGRNIIAGLVDVVVEPWLDVIDKGTNAATTWYLVPAPKTGRTALAVGFLRGHEEPQVRVKANAGQAVGGGALDPTEGSFEIDDIQYRVRHVLGSSLVDPIGTLYSNGSGS